MAERIDDERAGRTTPLMCVALVAGLVVGAKMAESYCRSAQQHRQRESEREQLKRWETEGGAIGGTATTPPAS